MKKLVYLFLGILFLTGCSEEDQNHLNSNASQEVAFGIIQKNQSNNVNGEVLTPAKVVVTLKNITADTLVYNKKVLDLFNFNGQYLTQNVTLTVGEYAVEDYFVTDANNKVIYASPKEGSELAQYVNDPLPLNFSVTLDEVAQVLPEVLVVNQNHTPEQFGYASFGFNVVTPESLTFDIVAFDENYDLTDFNLTITSDDQELFNQDLNAQTHFIHLNTDYDTFQLIVSKEAHLTQTFEYSKDELQTFIKENNLKIYLKIDTSNCYKEDNSLKYDVIEYYTFMPTTSKTIEDLIINSDDELANTNLPAIVKNLVEDHTDFTTKTAIVLRRRYRLGGIDSITLTKNDQNNLNINFYLGEYNGPIPGTSQHFIYYIFTICKDTTTESVHVYYDDRISSPYDFIIPFNKVILTTQEEVDHFSAHYDEILPTGELIIQGESITSLASFKDNIPEGGSVRVISITDQIIITNTSIETLDGIQNLPMKLTGVITNNPNLHDFCAIKETLNSNYYNEFYSINGEQKEELLNRFVIKENAFNPTQEEILNGNCSP